MRLDDASQLVESLASAVPEPAAGIALCSTGALAAALIEKACALSPDAALGAEKARANDLRTELLSTAERDVAAFYAVLEARRSGGDERGAWAVAALVLRDAAALLEETRFLAEDVAARCRPALRGEPLAAALLAAGAERAALALAEMDESTG
jgi:formiminotetrahydrofolate cyclodeaminase